MSDRVPPFSRDERWWMEQTLALAALAEGMTSPNPRVGCIVVRDGAAAGRGVHRSAGAPHAETLALGEAGAAARGATLYVNLEPCAHHGRTPPCVEQIVRSGVRRVVAAAGDPDPRVDGRGFARLRAAGLEVRSGLLEREARRLNDAFFHWQATGRPLVTLKAAASLDGLVAARCGSSRWITGEPARRFAHRLRLRHDAVLVGAATVRRDDPQLTVRLPGLRVARIRAVLAPRLDLDPAARLFAAIEGEPPAPVLLYASRAAPVERERAFAGRARVVRVAGKESALDLGEVLADLGRAGARSVLVEGGGRTLAAFLRAGLAERIALFTAPTLLGARGATPLVDGEAVAGPALGFRLAEPVRLALGVDRLTLARLVPPADPAAAGRARALD